MAASDDEEKLLRSVALQNAQSIRLARQRAEEELVRAKETLEERTRELAQSLAMMRATLESTTDGILVTDGAGRVTGFNEKFLKMWGLPAAIMDARDHRQVLEATSKQFNDQRQFRARIESIYATAPPESYDLLELSAGLVFERFSSIQFVEGQNVGRVWSYRDITDRRRALEALHKQSEWLRVTLASIGDAVITTDIEGRVSSLNPVAETMTGWAHEAARGNFLDQVFCIFDEEKRQPLENPAKRVLREGRIAGLASHSILVARDGNAHVIEDSAAPIRDAGGNVLGVVLIFRDVTERRQIERQRAAAEAALRESDRRKDEFLATLAHELRNPLAPMLNALQIMRLAGGNREPHLAAQEMMRRQVQHMVRLIDDLLDLSRVSRGKIQLRKEQIELGTVLHNAIETSRLLIQAAGHELIVQLPPTRVWLNADPTRMAQVVGNLLNNAAKYTKEGGRISLSVEQEGREAVLRVRDTGIGIPAEMLPRIFEMFAQVDTSIGRSQGGLGIGLTLVKSLVELHGGTVAAYSEGPGQGSEFLVRLPIVIEHLGIQAPVKGARDIEPSSPAPRRVLIVDDNADAARSLATLLKVIGHHTALAFDGASALATAHIYRPDIVLLDIGLPGLNGYEVARRIRQLPELQDVILVALTGWGQDEDRRRSKEAGFDHHLTKPADPAAIDELLAALATNSRAR